MRGNKITNNIFYYPNQPDSRYVRESGVNLQHNTIDSNVVWNGGRTPVKTGRQAFKKALADLTDKIPNADFSRRLAPGEIAQAPDRTVAADWRWYQRVGRPIRLREPGLVEGVRLAGFLETFGHVGCRHGDRGRPM
jgi:hypothetical protein